MNAWKGGEGECVEGGGGGGEWGSTAGGGLQIPGFFFFLQMNAVDCADVSMPVIHTLCKAIAFSFFSAFLFSFLNILYI